VITDITPFYGESGGQVGDTGTMIFPEGEAEVLDTTKTETEVFLHRVHVRSGTLSTGQAVRLLVDAGRRKSVMRHHSATHLLQRALREVLGDHVHQSGSLVNDARLRFDFTHFTAVSAEEIEKVEAIVNQFVLEDFPIVTEVLSKEQALGRGAMALFTEKYGDEVRVVTMGDGVSVELCGGTHCKSTGEIGLVKVVSEASVSAGLRRIEAVAGTRSLEYLRSLAGTVFDAADRLRCAPNEIPERIGSLQARIREQENALKDLTIKIATGTGSGADEEEFSVDGFTVVIRKIETDDITQMREVGDRLKDRIKSGVVFLAAPGKDKATFMTMTTADLSSTLDAGKLMKAVLAEVGGRGGGKALFAQGGADVAHLEKAILTFKKAVKGGA
ncbi:MAG TPA: DHHA1 domain-containing protein, partial [Deltaproteobacteria bacterium]|nr:DHHA1 domain-containing protein [Deltaproteobacteria bacterium]